MVSKNDKIIYSGVVIIIVGLGMLFLRSMKPENGPDTPKKVTYQDLDLERKKAISHKELEKRRVEVTNWKTAPKLGEGLRPVKNGLDEPTSRLQLESAKNHAAIDTNDASVYETPISSLESQINKKLVNEQQSAQMSALQRRNFIDNYKKRALAMGYVVELNDRLELIKATKVRQPSFAPQESAPVDVDSMEEDYEEEE